MKPRKYCGFEIGEIALWQLLYLSCGEATNACIAESTSARLQNWSRTVIAILPGGHIILKLS
jgi:hypothetical protein